MRTTLNLDPDVAQAARALARARAQSLGQVLSDLARRGLASEAAGAPHSASGFPVFQLSPGARPLTLEAVKQDEDEA
jgi:hypothetical protein